MNAVELSGYLCADPVIRQSANGKVANYTLASDRFKGGADYIPCVAFGRMAEHAEKFYKTGTKLIVTGRLESGSYPDKETGKKIFSLKVIVGTQEFAERKSVAESHEKGSSTEDTDAVDVPGISPDGCPFY